MLRKFYIPLLLTCLLFSCKSDREKEQERVEELKRNISSRDKSITASNAYNNLFFDSLKLVSFLQEHKVPDSISRRMISFYNTRNYQYAWFAPEGLTEQARGFWNLHNYQTTYGDDTLLKDKALQKTMDRLIADDDLYLSGKNTSYLNTELKLTWHFILYMLNNIEEGYVKRKEMERFVPRKRENALQLADSLLRKKHKDNKYYEEVNEPFRRLKQKLSDYYDLAKRGGWPVVVASAKKLKGDSMQIITLKKRLYLSGDLPSADTTPVFDDQLTSAINSFQFRHGYTADGNLTDAQLRDMNVPVEKRIQQILINMGRMQWMVNEPRGKLIVVNIPEFILHFRNGNEKVFDMDVVVGKESHNTMMFTGNLNQVVFSPYWNIPPSIVRKEILPEIEKDPDYLAKENMEIIGNDDGLPDIRQLPGEKNALGRVKFLFPNTFNIYFHDTPSKSLFQKDKRAFSHGCIRLSDPVKMANTLLQDYPEWTPERIENAMNSGKEQFVKLKDPVPVLITYYTAWVDENNMLHFAEDIYGHDAAMVKKMFIE
jgi:L,D-transpeptidase YcbB